MWSDIASRSLWLSAGAAIGRLLPFLVLIMLGNSLSISDFASVSVGFAWTAVAASLTTAGLANVTTQRLAVMQRSLQRAFVLRVIKLGSLFSATLLLTAVVTGSEVAHLAFGQALDQRVILPALISGSLWSLVMLLVAICNGQHKPRAAASVLGLGGALQGVGLVAGYGFSSGVHIVMWGAALGNGAALVWAIFCVRTHISQFQSTASDGTPNPQIRFGRSVAWSSLAAASVMPITFVAGSLVSRNADGTRQLAQFQALEQLHQLAVYLPGVLGQALLPVLAVHFNVRAGETVRKVVRASVMLAVAGTLLAAALVWQPGWLHRVIGNPALVDATATRAMLMNAGLSVSLGLLGSALLARGQYARATLLNLGWAAVFLGLGWHWHADGAGGIQTARLCASWLLVFAASASLWLGTLPENAVSAPSARSTSKQP